MGRRTFYLSLLGALLLFIALPPAWGQTIPFELRVVQEHSTGVVANGATLNFVADGIGQTVAGQVIATYQGTTSVVFPTGPVQIGSTYFSVTTEQEFPLTLAPGEALTLNVSYKPATPGQVAAQLSIAYEEAAVNPDQPPVTGAILLNLGGVAPDLSVAYALQANGNVLPLGL